MCRLLEKLGHEVTGATTVAEALAAASREPFDLLISDLSLPDGNGIDLLGRLTSEGRHPQAIALTGYGTPDEVRRTRAAGFSAHLTKPLDVASLQRTIESLPQMRVETHPAAKSPLPGVGTNTTLRVSAPPW